MKSHNFLLLFRDDLTGEYAVENELEQIRSLLRAMETTEQFCLSHELVDRIRITSSQRRILSEARYLHLRPFRFLINKN